MSPANDDGQMGTDPVYDTIGVGYATQRRADPRIASQIDDAIGDTSRLLNVGAGTGNYEPAGRVVVAVEPSNEMLNQRVNSNPVIQGVAEALPFVDGAFDAAIGIFTVHHWSDREQGLRELKRVSSRQVLLVYDVEVSLSFWLADYFTDLAVAPWELAAPTPADLGKVLDVTEVRPIMIPDDCIDGFTGCYWNRPERYLDPAVQAGMSTLSFLDPDIRAAHTADLAAALESGDWDRRYGHLRDRSVFDIGYRLVLSG